MIGRGRGKDDKGEGEKEWRGREGKEISGGGDGREKRKGRVEGYLEGR